MPEADVKTIVREALSEMRREDSDLGRMEDSLPLLSGYLSEFAAPDFTCVMVGIPPAVPRAFPGVEGLFAANRVRRVEFHLDGRAALRAAGLDAA